MAESFGSGVGALVSQVASFDVLKRSKMKIEFTKECRWHATHEGKGKREKGKARRTTLPFLNYFNFQVNLAQSFTHSQSLYFRDAPH